MRPSSGITFGGRYQLSSRIAIGGMGEVWQATDLVIGRTVAIKILKDEYLGDPGFLERFRAEARHAALVNHEGIANVFDYGEEDGSAFLVMELVPGEALSTVLERERVLPTDKVLDIVAQTASALHAAHQAGLVHRDIKPGNLLITPDGRVKITDFGIARIADQVPLTATGQVMGTVQYLSPEQASGHPASPGTDIYSLGIVAYEALAGRRPFTGESQVAIAMAQINEAPPELSATIAEPVRNLVYACIAKKPEDRPGSAAALSRGAQALRRSDLGAAIAAVPAIGGTNPYAAFTPVAQTGAATRLMPTEQRTPTAPIPVAPPRRSPWTWPLVAIVSVLAVVLIAILVVFLVQPTNKTGPIQTSSSAAASPSTSATKSSTPSNTPAPATSAASLVNVGAQSDYIGRPYADVEKQLSAMKLGVKPADGPVADTPDKNGLVTDVSPVGNVPEGTIITVTRYRDYTQPPAPTSPPTATPASSKVGDTVTITWTAYQGCPTGYTLSGYQFTVTNASMTGGTAVSPTQTSVTITLTAAPQATVSYVAKCGSYTSASSGNTQVTVQ